MSQFNDMFSSHYYGIAHATIMAQVNRLPYPDKANARIINIPIKDEHLTRVAAYGGDKFCAEMMQFINKTGNYEYDFSSFRKKDHTMRYVSISEMLFPRGYMCVFKNDDMR